MLNQQFTSFLDSLPEANPGKCLNLRDWIKELGLGENLDNYIKSATEISAAPKTKMESGKLIIEGYHIKTSQTDSEIQKYSNFTSIELRALHTITIDNDLADTNSPCAGKLHSVNLSLIAPTVEVIGDRTIDLSGKDGVCLPKAKTGAKGKDGPSVGEATPGNKGSDGEHGEHGLPGESGGSAGNLFIVCDELLNKEHLQVKLNGGNGAKGQDGGDGGRGGDGSDVTWKQISICIPNLVHIIAPTLDGWVRIYPENPGIWFELQGGIGGIGGNGGMGGKGGEHGKHGLRKIEFNNDTQVKQFTEA